MFVRAYFFGHMILFCCESCLYSYCRAVLHWNYPQIHARSVDDALRDARIANTPEGYPGTVDHSKFHKQDGSKAARMLNVEYRTLQESVVDTVNSLRERFPGSV